MTIQDPEARRLLETASTALRNIADTLEVIVNNMEEREVTQAQVTNPTSKLVTFPQKPASPAPHFMLQDVFLDEPAYCHDLSGRV